MKTTMGFDDKAFFVVPDDVGHAFRAAGAAGSAKHAGWKAVMAGYALKYPELAAEFDRCDAANEPTKKKQTLAQSAKHAGWKAVMAGYALKYPELAAEFER